jgi:5'-nucleotidase (lipoprotein e(P4) family)
MKFKPYLLAVSLSLVSVVSTYFITVSTASPITPAKVPQDIDYQTGGTLYMQKAAEYRALAYQAYNLARTQLDSDLDKRNLKKLPKAEQKRPRAVVLDIDDTVLDNSPAQAKGIVTGTSFNSKDWLAWVEMRKAKAIPGSVEFVNYAVSKGVKVYFASNRDEIHRAATIGNLKDLGFQDISDENVLLRDKVSSKDARRAYVESKYRIVLLVGDNLDDFSGRFEKKSVVDRFAEADAVRELWGKRFIVIPNAMYGTWENAIYNYERLSESEKAERRASALELP